MREPGLGVGGVEVRGSHAAAARRAQHHGQAHAGPVVVARQHGGDLVEPARHEVRVLELGDRTQALHRRTHRHTHDRLLGDRRVHHALGSEVVDEALGHLEGAAVDPDVLAEQVDALVALHLLPQALGDGDEVGGETVVGALASGFGAVTCCRPPRLARSWPSRSRPAAAARLRRPSSRPRPTGPWSRRPPRGRARPARTRSRPRSRRRRVRRWPRCPPSSRRPRRASIPRSSSPGPSPPCTSRAVRRACSWPGRGPRGRASGARPIRSAWGRLLRGHAGPRRGRPRRPRGRRRRRPGRRACRRRRRARRSWGRGTPAGSGWSRRTGCCSRPTPPAVDGRPTS